MYLYYLNESLGIINESVSGNDVKKAIKNKTTILINYSDETNSHPDIRYIEPYVYGLTTAGNPCIRAYQYWGDTKRGVPKWKLFRLDRITSWTPTEDHFNTEPRARKWAAEAFNNNGDESMARVFYIVDLTPGEELSDYEILKRKTEKMKNSKPVNIFTDKAFNKDKTPSISTSNTTSQGPIIDEPKQVANQPEPKSDINNTQNAASAEQGKVQQPNDNPMSSDDFQKMLQRNLAITDKEKKKRNFSLSNNREPEVDNSNDKEQQSPTINIPEKPSNTSEQEPETIPTEKEPENNAGPIGNDEFQKMLQRNLAITDKEKKKRNFSLNNKKIGPIEN